MTPEQLKTSILKMAVSGKLVPNNEKEQVTIQNDEWEVEEQPFDIPNNWIWKKFSYFGELRMGKTILKNELLNEGIPVYSATQSDDILGYLKNVELELHPDDLVIPARGNSIGFVTIIKDAIATCTQTTICCKDIHDILPMYLYYCCYAFKPVWFKYSGSAIPQVTVAQISKCMVPVPPIEEQKRIVSKIEELLPYVDRYAEAYKKLEQFNAKFPEDMKKSILQYAIQGKLVEQRPEEGTAEELYQQIQIEKQRLINEGKYKKEKPLADISEEEIPFDIPDTWKWVRLSDICNISDGTHQTPHYVEEDMPFISAQNVKPYRFMPEIHRNVSVEDFREYNKVVAPSKGDILMTRVGAGIGEAAIIDQDFEFSIYVSLTLIKSCLPQYDMRYLLTVLNAPLGINLARKKTLGKGASQGNLNLCFIREFVLPLPPLKEQERIVAKVEELLPYCNRLIK